MKFYQDITLLPDSDIALGFLWQKVYQQVHIALVEQKEHPLYCSIGIGFPAYGSRGFPMGNQLRLFAEDIKQLEQLDLVGFLRRFEDYVHIKSIQAVPHDAKPVAFIRHRVKGKARIEKDMHAKAALWAKKSGKSLADCLKQLEKSKPSTTSNTPFIWMESLQTKANNPESSPRFPLFIRKLEVEVFNSGHFNSYGLSALGGNSLATVPHF